MARRLFAAVSIAVSIALPVAACAQAQPKQEYVPQVGQAGKDVVWVPTPEALVERMLTMAKVTKNDYVVDLGSGDGRTVIMAAKKFGATAMGIEYNPDMVAISNKALAKESEAVRARAKFVRGDIFEIDFSNATVVTMYLLPSLNIKLRPRILDMKPGTRIVSHAFTMEDWTPDETATVEGRDAMLWIVPAKAGGTWKVSVPSGKDGEEVEVAIKQSFQKFTGTAKAGGKELPLTGTKLVGDQIAFEFVDGNGLKRQFSGSVAGNAMEGTTKLQTGANVKWTAVRTAAN